MKSFFKSLFASVLGCFIALGICFLIFFIVMASISMSFETTEKFDLKKNTVFTLKLDGILYDRVQKNPLLGLIDQDAANEIGLDEILLSIKKAKTNNNIKGIYIYAGAFSASPASLKEIRDQLLDFKETGKFIVTYADTYTQGCYYLSSVADKVIMNPEGMLDLHGLSVQPTFYKGLLDKLGIEVQIFKVGTYKSAVEPFMLDKMSEANKMQVSSFINSIWSTMLTDISQSRNVSVDKLNAIADSLPLLQKQSFVLDNKLVDTLMYQTDVETYLKKLVKIDNSDKLETATLENIKGVPLSNQNKSSDVIAVLYAEGSITDGSGKSGITSKRYVKELERLKDDDQVKAVVFRVNSGGGSAYASEQIWKAVSDLKAKKPIVVSMGDYAASGGYYISCNASKIIAEPTTITGSIGIFGMFPNVEGLTKKIGLSYDEVKTNKYADFGNIVRPMRADEKVIVQNYIERGYDLFITRCAEGRSISKDSINNIGQGRVWTGSQALELGLVDQLGGINAAILEAAKLANIKDYSTNNYPKQADFWEAFFTNQKEEMATRTMKEYLGNDYHLFKTMKEIRDQDFIQARLPYDFSIN